MKKSLLSFKNNGSRKILNIAGLKIKWLDRNSTYQRMLNTQNLHSKVFTKYKNCCAGMDVVIVATGPSLKQFIPIKDAVYIGVNRAFEYDKVLFDYYFIFDNSMPTPDYLPELNEYKGNNVKKFYGICSDSELLQCTISESDAIKAGAERFYLYSVNSKKIPTYDISSEAFFNANSVMFPAIQFALWTNPERIYIVGCDNNLSGYYNSKCKNILKTNKIYEGFLKVKDFAEIFYPDTKIYSVNPVGLKGIFNDIYQ